MTSVKIKQNGDSDNLSTHLNQEGQIIIEHDTDEYWKPYVVIDTDSWPKIKQAIDQLIERK